MSPGEQKFVHLDSPSLRMVIVTADFQFKAFTISEKLEGALMANSFHHWFYSFHLPKMSWTCRTHKKPCKKSDYFNLFLISGMHSRFVKKLTFNTTLKVQYKVFIYININIKSNCVFLTNRVKWGFSDRKLVNIYSIPDTFFICTSYIYLRKEIKPENRFSSVLTCSPPLCNMSI